MVAWCSAIQTTDAFLAFTKVSGSDFVFVLVFPSMAVFVLFFHLSELAKGRGMDLDLQPGNRTAIRWNCSVMLAILRERRFLICAFAPTQRIDPFTDLGQGVLGGGYDFLAECL